MAYTLNNDKVDQLFFNQGPNTALSERKARPVGKKKKRNKNPGGQLTAQDLITLFQSMPVPNRGFKNPNADKPSKMGQGMAWFDANNSPDQVAERQNRVDQNRQSFLNKSANQGAAVVDFMKQTKGYTDAQGNFVPPTLPSEISSPYGTGSVTFTDKPTRGTMTDPLTGKTVFMDEYLPQQSQVQDSKYGAMPGQENGGALAQKKPKSVVSKDLASIFPGASMPAPALPETRMPNASFTAPDWMNEALNKPNQLTPKPAPAAPAFDTSGFDNQIKDMQAGRGPSSLKEVPFSNPFIGAPYGGRLNARQEEIMSLFAPVEAGKVTSGGTNALHSILPGIPGQLFWPMMQNEDVRSFSQFFPGMNWNADYSDASRQQIQKNFDTLIKAGAIRVGPNGKYQLIPQYPTEQLIKRL